MNYNLERREYERNGLHIHLASICDSQIFSANLWQVMDRKQVNDSWVQDTPGMINHGRLEL
jgi:hypothetical protein